MLRYTPLSFFTLIIAATWVAAYASQNNMEDDALAISKSRIPLSQAISVAEKHVNGKASRAVYERINKGWIYDVEVVKDTTIFDVQVDADLGGVISSAPNQWDQDAVHDKHA